MQPNRYLVPALLLLILALFLPALAVHAQPATPQPALYDEPHRPQFHFTPERNWMNDPNGLVFLDGEYHLFYQYNPFANVWGHMSWGHAVSKDLLHWQHLPVALWEEKGIAIFSGSAVVDHNNTSEFGTQNNPPMVAFYTGHTDQKQTQNLAYSTDRGRTWNKYWGNPVLDLNLKDFRDPKVFWHAPTERWVMVVALPTEKKVRFYASPNLRKWTHLSDFGPEGAAGGIWECPDLLEIPVYEDGKPRGLSRWVLVVNINGGTPAGGSACQYFVGNFDGQRFVNDNPRNLPLWADHGADFFAAQSWSNLPKDSLPTWIGWMSNWRYANHEPTTPFRTAQSLPRHLKLLRTDAGLRLAQSPVNLQPLHADTLRLPPGLSLRGERPPVLQKTPASGAYAITCEFENVNATEFGLKIAAGTKHETVVGYDAAKNTLFIDRTRSGPEFHKEFPARHTAPLRPGLQRIQLTLLVDRSSIELFADEGLTVITDRIFPSPEDDQVKLYTVNGEAKLHSFTLTTLKSTWK